MPTTKVVGAPPAGSSAVDTRTRRRARTLPRLWAHKALQFVPYLGSPARGARHWAQEGARLLGGWYLQQELSAAAAAARDHATHAQNTKLFK